MIQAKRHHMLRNR
ncbi:Protein of unknown function [Leuconostoc citreum LBAE C11]|nr:Protein of unknown function [Leuconostoc citreum LBAE C11]